jgi:hypothetical protein
LDTHIAEQEAAVELLAQKEKELPNV